MTAKNMPYKKGFGPFAGEVYRVPMAYPFRWPGGPDACAEQALDVITGLDPRPGRRGERRRRGDRADPGRGRLHRAARGLPAGPGRSTAPTTGSSSSPTRSSPASAGPATGSPCDHEGVVPDLITHRQGHRGRPAAGRGDRPRRADGRRARRRPGRHLRRQPGGVRRRAGRHRDHGQGGPARRGPAHRRHHAAPAAPARRAPPGHRRGPRPRRDDRHRAGPARHPGARRRRRPRRSQRPATPPA